LNLPKFKSKVKEFLEVFFLKRKKNQNINSKKYFLYSFKAFLSIIPTKKNQKNKFKKNIFFFFLKLS